METTKLSFTTATWNTVSQAAAAAFRLDAEETFWLVRSKTARLIAALPYLAGCDQAERTALAHVGVYLMASRNASRAVFDHAPSDDADLLRRLATIGHFEGGDPVVLERGMKLLALQMICGYARDQAKDTVTGEYNPLLSGSWDATDLVDRLSRDIVDTECPEMDALFTTQDAKFTWWF